jgi:twinkle protein
MTMSSDLLEDLQRRALDVELLDRLGFDGARRDSTDFLTIPFIRNGVEMYRKWRTLRGERKFFAIPKGLAPIAWNEDCLRDDTLLDYPLVITEGELDAPAAIQSGFPRTISVPNGAPPPNGNKEDEDLVGSPKYAWLDSIETHLLSRERVKEIIIAADGDENGSQLLHDLSRLLIRARCRYVVYPLAKDPAARGRARLKDLNEVLEDYGAKGVAATLDKAPYIAINGIYKMSELPPPKPRRIYDIQFDAFGEHCRLRTGDFSVWTGVPSHGKTTFVQDVVCRVVERYGVRVAWASFEQDPQVDHKRAFRRWYNRTRIVDLTDEQRVAADDWVDRNHLFLVPDDDDDPTLDWVLEKIEAAVLRHGVEIVVLDPWNEMDHLRERNETLTEYTGRAIKALKKSAKKLNYHLIVVAHPSKLQRKADGTFPMPDLYDISDSAHWNNKADLGIVVHRTTATDTIVKTLKSRYHDQIGKPGGVKMQFSRDAGRFIEIERGQ